MLFSALMTLALGISSALAAPTSNPPVRCGYNPSTEAVANDELDFKSRMAVFAPVISSSVPFTATIPVHWHIITPDNTNSEANVTSETISRAMDVLNDDYSRAGFLFLLADVTRTTNKDWFSGVSISNDRDQDMKKSLRQGSSNALNIYTAAPTSTDRTGTLLGYGTPPSGLASNTVADGVVVHYATLPGGSLPNFNMGRTLTHEVGHWFGLLHTFHGDSCDGDGDGIADTPPQMTPTTGCPAEGLKDSCPGGGTDAIHNFMDYSDDACMTKFSAGQIRRMQEVVTVYRSA